MLALGYWRSFFESSGAYEIGLEDLARQTKLRNTELLSRLYTNCNGCGHEVQGAGGADLLDSKSAEIAMAAR